MENKDEFIARQFLSGKTLQEIGDSLSLTRERIRQILSEQGYSAYQGGHALKARIRAEANEKARNERYISRYGFTHEVMQQLFDKGITRKYNEQKKGARARGIEWRLTFKEWYTAWVESGFFHLRGRGKGYCMARKGDIGAYELGNIYFCTIGQNFKDSHFFRSVSKRKKPR